MNLVDKLSDDQKLLVDIISSFYVERRRWPDWLYVKRRFRQQSDSDPKLVRDSFPVVGQWAYGPNYGILHYDLHDSSDNAICKLRIAAGLHSGGYEPTARALVQVIQRLAQIAGSADPDAGEIAINRDQLANTLRWDPNVMLDVPGLIHLEPLSLVKSSNVPKDGNWELTLGDEGLLPYREVRSIKGYVEKTEAIVAAMAASETAGSAVQPIVVDAVTTQAPTIAGESVPDMENKRRQVFVVHGRNRSARDAMFEFLRSLDLQPIEWTTAISLTGKASPYIGEILDVALGQAQAIVVLMTPDEITYLRGEYADGEDDAQTQAAAQARPNVLFEAGMAMGRNPERTVLVELGQIRPFSDVAGRHALKLSNSPESRRSLAGRLKTAGCAVDDSGADWLTAGNFTPPLPPGGGLALGKKLPSGNRTRVSFDVNFYERGRGVAVSR